MGKGVGVPDSFINQSCDLFRLLSDRTRMIILLYLMQEEQNVGTLCRKLALPQPTVSHHLAMMRMSRLIQKRRNGRQMIYSINPEMLRGLALELFRNLSANGKTIVMDQFVFSKKGK